MCCNITTVGLTGLRQNLTLVCFVFQAPATEEAEQKEEEEEAAE